MKQAQDKEEFLKYDQKKKVQTMTEKNDKFDYIQTDFCSLKTPYRE